MSTKPKNGKKSTAILDEELINLPEIPKKPLRGRSDNGQFIEGCTPPPKNVKINTLSIDTSPARKLQNMMDYLQIEKSDFVMQKLLEACEGKDLICPHCERLIRNGSPNVNALTLLWEQMFGKAKQKMEIEAKTAPISAGEMSIMLRDAKAAERAAGTAAIAEFDKYSVYPIMIGAPPPVIIDVVAEDYGGITDDVVE